jgi:hypothetical protein
MGVCLNSSTGLRSISIKMLVFALLKNETNTYLLRTYWDALAQLLLACQDYIHCVYESVTLSSHHAMSQTELEYQTQAPKF